MENKYMKIALDCANQAFISGEVPVGAVIVKDGQIIAMAHNMVEKLHDATAHAEMIAIKRASESLENWRLDGCELYATLEPCIMCVGAIINSRISKLYFGAYDINAGAAGGKLDLISGGRTEVFGGIMELECSNLLGEFFKKRR